MPKAIRHFLCLALPAILATPAFAQDLGEVALRQALLDLGCGFRLLCVAAHPDDEDGATLALHRYKYGVKTYAVLATRGEGGQNEIGPELYDDLAVIRTREMMAAAGITGAELHFLDLPEFGFSKTIEETQSIWGPDEALRRIVLKIRELRPHVIITHHGRDKDHGHHQAIGKAVIDAFDRAADPTAFPEQIAGGLQPWQPLRLYIRAWQCGADSVEINISELDSLRGMTYTEIAAKALEAHASQGMAFFIERYLSGQPKAWYDLIKEIPNAPTIAEERFGPLFDRMNGDTPTLDLSALLQSPREKLLGPLLAAASIPGSENAITRALAAAAEWRLKAQAMDAIVVPGETAPIKVEFADFADPEAREVRFTATITPSSAALAEKTVPMDGRLAEWVLELVIPETTPLTLPHAAHIFDSSCLPLQFEINAEVLCGDLRIPIATPLHLDVAPPMLVECPEAPFLLRKGTQTPFPMALRLTHFARAPRAATLRLEPPDGWEIEPCETAVRLETEDEQRIIEVRLRPPANCAEGRYPIRVRLQFGKQQEQVIDQSFHVVDVLVRPNLRAGLIKSYDDTIGNTLTRLGVPWEPITPAGLAPDRLLAFDTVIIDMRAYQCRPDLVANNAAILEYVQRGGRVIVMYQKTFEWKPDYAPYPLHLSRNRVTREDAPVAHLVPDHPFFHTPNEIRPEDWNGWIQERGLYLPEKWDPAYTPMIACNDPGEDIPPGALLAAKHGQGAYIYTALVWYRQLRDLHPGALRLFANLLALAP